MGHLGKEPEERKDYYCYQYLYHQVDKHHQDTVEDKEAAKSVVGGQGNIGATAYAI